MKLRIRTACQECLVEEPARERELIHHVAEYLSMYPDPAKKKEEVSSASPHQNHAEGKCSARCSDNHILMKLGVALARQEYPANEPTW